MADNSLSVIKAVRDYLNKMLVEVPGMKALLMDEETMNIVSMVFSQSEATTKEVFLFRSIVPRKGTLTDEKGNLLDEELDESQQLKAVSHLKAVCFLRPTAENITLLERHLEKPRFASYHLYFTNVLPNSYLRQLASADASERVQCVKEYFADFYPINESLYSLNLRHLRALSSAHWGSGQHAMFNRLVDGLVASLLAVRVLPWVRYYGKSDLCRKLANEISSRIHDDNTVFDYPRSDGDPLLLIVDRSQDPVTPLLTQWSYQAMVHELIGIHNHRVDLTQFKVNEKTEFDEKQQQQPVAKKEKSNVEFEQVVLSSHSDSFFAESMFQNWGQVAANIHDLVSNYAKQNKANSDMDSFDKIKEFIDLFPEFRKLQTNACKHMAVAEALHRQIDQRNLLELTELEQELALLDLHDEVVPKVMEKLESPNFTWTDKLRLTMLYALRYEKHQQHQELQRMKMLLIKDLAEDEKHKVELIDALLDYAGADVRGGDLFGTKQDVTRQIGSLFKQLKAEFQGAESAITSHKPYVSELVRSINSRSLKPADYPYAEGDAKKQYQHRLIYIFMVGGATYEEAKWVHEVNQANGSRQHIILGGTSVINSQMFLEELAGPSKHDHAIDMT